MTAQYVFVSDRIIVRRFHIYWNINWIIPVKEKNLNSFIIGNQCYWTFFRRLFTNKFGRQRNATKQQNSCNCRTPSTMGHSIEIVHSILTTFASRNPQRAHSVPDAALFSGCIQQTYNADTPQRKNTKNTQLNLPIRRSRFCLRLCRCSRRLGLFRRCSLLSPTW